MVNPISKTLGVGKVVTKGIKKAVAGRLSEPAKKALTVAERLVPKIPGAVGGAVRYVKNNPRKSIAGAALLPLAPLAYGASHGFRDPVGAAKVLATGALLGPGKGMNANEAFTLNSIANDMDSLAAYGKGKAAPARPQTRPLVNGNLILSTPLNKMPVDERPLEAHDGAARGSITPMKLARI